MATPTNLQLQNLSIVNWQVDQLIPYARNARTHSPKQVKQIAESIREFGFLNPVLINPDGGVIAGHGRILAAKKLGFIQVPAIVLPHLTQDQERAFRLADNALAANAGWDFEKLRLELEALTNANFNLDLLAFNEEELKKALATEVALRGSDPDSVPEPQAEAVSRLGEIYELGKHRLLVGDGTQPENLANVLAGRPCNLIFTDLPFGVNYHGKTATRMTIANDDLGSEFVAFLQSACNAIVEIAQGAIYICMSSSRLHELHRAFSDAGGHWSTFIVWAKHHFTLGRSDFQRQYEAILYGWREGTSHYWCGDRKQGDVWFINRPFRNDMHPTTKPVELIERALCNSSCRGDVVLDPFAGSGSTMIACENLGRQACLVEIDARYVDSAIRRWQEYTGRRARLVGEEKYFDEIESERNVPALKGDSNE